MGVYFIPLNIKNFNDVLESKTIQRAALLGVVETSSPLYSRIKDISSDEFDENRLTRFIRNKGTAIIWGHRVLLLISFLFMVFGWVSGNDIPFLLINTAIAVYFLATSLMTFSSINIELKDDLQLTDVFSPRFVKFVSGAREYPALRNSIDLVIIVEMKECKSFISTLDSLSDKGFEDIMKHRETLWKDSNAESLERYLTTLFRSTTDFSQQSYSTMLEHLYGLSDTLENLFPKIRHSVQKFLLTSENEKDTAIFSPALEDLVALLEDPTLSDSSRIKIEETITTIKKKLLDEVEQKEQEREQERIEAAIKTANRYHDIP